MIKSLYTRIVIVFVGIVMFSLFIAFIGTSLLYGDNVQGSIEDSFISIGERAIDIYESAPSSDLKTIMGKFSGLAGLNIQLYDAEGAPLLTKSAMLSHVPKGKIEYVLEGNVARNLKTNMHHLPIVGIPFTADGKPYALFITAEQNSAEADTMNSIHIMYFIIVFFGSLLIIIAARYVVNPIVKLTQATKRMAKGELDLEIPTKRKDEIGVLSTSFNEMAKELSKLERMRQAFVANVSHEFQSPLTSIQGFTKALKQKKLSEENRLRYLTIIEEESERLSRLSQNLLRLSRLQQEKEPLHISTFRLDEQLRNVVIALEPQWSEKEIEMDIQLQQVSIAADEDQLKQVWTNIISNAIKFTPIQGIIRIAAKKQDNHAIISINDNGIGIPEEERADIFKPFHKVEKSNATNIKGNGLGLSIVKEIVEIHQGDIHVSGELGAGTTFTVSLPISHTM